MSRGIDAKAAVEARGGELEIVPSRADVLQLDIDVPRWNCPAKVWELLVAQGLVPARPPYGGLWESVGVLVTTSQHGNTHVYIPLLKGAMPRQQRVAIQIALGSDPAHELLTSFAPASEDVLFETPQEAPRVYEWLNALTAQEEEVEF